MRPTLFAALTLLAATTSAPAAAQIVGKRDYGPVPAASPFLPDSRLPGPSIGREVRDLKGRIDRARESGALPAGEARRLEREARAIGRLARLYGRDGLSPSERAELDARAAYLRDAVDRPRPGGRRGG
ncbi:MAG TPA: hypothetical protein VFQ67_06875 [Allosphingosinicella sp.]|jgi:hypothetical protein|nr:hypothetical protein [Allosphingosinicella sp.]